MTIAMISARTSGEASVTKKSFSALLSLSNGARSGVQIRNELAFEARDLVLQHQLAFLQPLHLQLVGIHVERQAHDYLIEIPMLDAQVAQLLEVPEKLAIDVVFGFRHRRACGA